MKDEKPGQCTYRGCRNDALTDKHHGGVSGLCDKHWVEAMKFLRSNPARRKA